MIGGERKILMLTKRLICCVSVSVICLAACSIVAAAKAPADRKPLTVGDSNIHLHGRFDNSRIQFTRVDMISADDAGAELTLEFTGKGIGAYVIAGPDADVLEATIDGGKPVTVDLFHRFSRGLHYPRTVMFDADLKPGKHILKLRTTVTEGRSRGGKAARILQFVAN